VLFLATSALAALPGWGGAQSAATTPSYSLRGSLNAPALWSSIPLSVGGSVPVHISWSRLDIALASAFTTSLLMDAGQTRGLARNGWQWFHEGNPLLGRHPTVGRVNVYTTVAGLTVLGAAAMLPRRVRPWFLCAAFVLETLTVAQNAQQGIAIGFP
jgi:hypothetical protein